MESRKVGRGFFFPSLFLGCPFSFLDYCGNAKSQYSLGTNHWLAPIKAFYTERRSSGAQHIISLTIEETSS